MPLVFDVMGDPVGKARPRVVGGHAYTPDKTAAYEDRIRLAYKRAVKDRPEEERTFGKDAQLSLTVSAFYRMPKRVNKTLRDAMMSFRERPRKKPDLDNILKVVADALNGLAYHDDSQIVSMSAAKYWSHDPYILICITEVGGA